MTDGKRHRMLIVDNDQAICWVLKQAFTDEGYLVDVAPDGQRALDMIEQNAYDLVIMDVMMPVMDGITALERMKNISDRPEGIIMTAHSSMENTVEAMKHGAFDYIVKPFDIDEIISLAGRAVERYRTREKKKADITSLNRDKIIGESPRMHEIYKLLGRVASTDSTVLITGETGTGKDLFARAIHYHSSRRDGPFVVVNCASIPGELLESELFGSVKGAFTGAVSDRKGKCELADDGTLFLDEIGTMRIDLQAKLLIFLQRNEFERVGSSETISVDVRVITATNANLKELTAQDRFRKDLYYRLMVVPMHIPPLRERKTDIEPLVRYFVDRYNARYNRRFRVSQELLNDLKERDWPGNVRELENYMHRLVVLQSGDFGFEESVSFDVPREEDPENITALVVKLLDGKPGTMLDAARETVEKPLIAAVMTKTGGNQSEAAKTLGVSRNTLRKMLDRYGLST